eukprot:jgi/Ulvmu1/12494/UM009_0147.1
MQLKRNILAFAMAMLAVTLIAVNVIYAVVNTPNFSSNNFHSQHRDWFAYPDCEDMSPHCAEWVANGNCGWSWLCQAQCKFSCDRCHDTVTPLHKVHPFAGLVGFHTVADAMQQKVQTAMSSGVMSKSHDQIERSNLARATNAPIDLESCQRSTEEHHNADLSQYPHLAAEAKGAGNLHEACTFRLTPIKPRAECEDKSTCTAGTMDCVGSDVQHTLHTCPKSCSACGTCIDQDTSCRKWSSEGQCFSNSGFMLDRCRHSCIKACLIMYDPHPPYFVSLWNGLLMPTVGFGTAGLASESSNAVLAAINAGYRHIDSAEAREWYREDLLGKALSMSPVPRDQIFITTKVHPKHLGYKSTIEAVTASLSDLKTTYVDLLLLHYSHCFGALCKSAPDGTWKDSWRAMEELTRQGRVLAIGVSNFHIPQLVELVEMSSIPPMVIQGHSDPFTQSLAVRRLALSLGIQYTAYSSLGTQHHHLDGGINPVLGNSALAHISARLGVSTAQVVLKYTLGTGQIVLPRSQNPVHINESLQAHSIQFHVDDLMLLHSLDGKLSQM